MEVTRVEITYTGTTTMADAPSVALMHWCIAHGVLGRINYQRIKEICLQRFMCYPKILDYPVNYECREDYAIGVLFWLQERGNIDRVRFSVTKESGIGTGNVNDSLAEYNFNQVSQNAEWRMTYNHNNNLIFPPPDDVWRDFTITPNQVTFEQPELKEQAIRNFIKRRTFANYKHQNEPTIAKTGEPMQFFCMHCRMPTETLEEDCIFDPNLECSQCRALKNRGWLDEAQKLWNEKK